MIDVSVPSPTVALCYCLIRIASFLLRGLAVEVRLRAWRGILAPTLQVAFFVEELFGTAVIAWWPFEWTDSELLRLA